MAQPPPYPGTGPTPYPPNVQVGNAPYPMPSNSPYPPSGNPPPFNPSYIPPENGSFATSPLIAQNQPPLNAPQYVPYQQPQYVQYPGVQPPQPVNIAAINSVPSNNRYLGPNYGPGWYRYNSATRKKAFIAFGVCAGIMIAIFLIVFVTMTIKAQQDHDAFRKKHFGD